MSSQSTKCLLLNSPNRTIRITTNKNGIGIDVNISLADIIPSGTTGQRPGSPVEGPDSLRYNTTLHTFEFYNGSDWVEWGDGGTGGGGSTLYTGVSPTNITVGGLPAGSDIANMELWEILEAMLVTYLEPAFTAFAISTLSASYEVGQTFSGLKSFSWSFSNAGNVQPGTLDILDITASVTLASNISTTSPASLTVNVTHNTPSAHTWRVRANNTNSDQFTADVTANWYYSRYWGWSATSTPSNLEILANSSELSTSKGKSGFNIDVVGSNRYVYFAYPVSFGALGSLMVGGFESITAFTQSTQTITNAQGVAVSCYVYVSNNVFSVDVNNVVTV